MVTLTKRVRPVLSDLILVWDDDGWCLYPPGVTDADIMRGEMPLLVGDSRVVRTTDRERAFAIWLSRNQVRAK